MHHEIESHVAGHTGAWLYVAEVGHRIVNEYASAISGLRLAAARAPTDEARAAVLDATHRLSAYAAAHSLLKPPVAAGQVDLADHLARLCVAIGLARFQDQFIELSVRTPHRIIVDASRCWKAGLVVSELITNAARHAFSADRVGGEIAVTLTAARGQITCEVRDTGNWAASCAPGLGSALLTSLAAELGGTISRRSDGSGTNITLTFPELPARSGEIRIGSGRRASPPARSRAIASGLVAHEA